MMSEEEDVISDIMLLQDQQIGAGGHFRFSRNVSVAIKIYLRCNNNLHAENIEYERF